MAGICNGAYAITPAFPCHGGILPGCVTLAALAWR
jgi:hypothetical protein